MFIYFKYVNKIIFKIYLIFFFCGIWWFFYYNNNWRYCSNCLKFVLKCVINEGFVYFCKMLVDIKCIV